MTSRPRSRASRWPGWIFGSIRNARMGTDLRRQQVDRRRRSRPAGRSICGSGVARVGDDLVANAAREESQGSTIIAVAIAADAQRRQSVPELLRPYACTRVARIRAPLRRSDDRARSRAVDVNLCGVQLQLRATASACTAKASSARKDRYPRSSARTLEAPVAPPDGPMP